MARFNFTYDKKTDDLLLTRPNSKSSGSIDYGDIILDFDYKGNFVGLQFINATKTLSALFNMTKKEVEIALKNLTESKVIYRDVKNDLFLITFGLFWKINKKTEQKYSNLGLQGFEIESPALVQT